MYAFGPRTIASASPTAGTFHWRLLRATWPCSEPQPSDPADGSIQRSGSIVASSPSVVEVIRSAAPRFRRSARTSWSSGLKWAGTYIAEASHDDPACGTSARGEPSPGLERPLPVGGVVEHDADHRTGPGHGREALDDPDGDP